MGMIRQNSETNVTVEKSAGYVVRDYLRSLIQDKEVYLECEELDKYGRLLVTMYLDDLCINAHLVDKGYGKPYAGGTKTPFTTAELEDISMVNEN
ncbi:hypothetical protein CYMTET_6427 [Cymbomonas tetramitiformis]|uniref:TNase-like domain-containing protein n=1 Tax=Cymbomonas tetramitiformis TaxID=36881 RepID=A0AAE0GXG3_9CHLO|nr:hypothetical protein CYMTET_6427 [Cymbomonas tetramitiformis]